jgi:FtsP/CotA-like multicopper oxidase with cupredoxin domain
MDMSTRQPRAPRGPLVRHGGLALSLLCAFGLVTADEGSGSGQPPADDPSAFTDQPKKAGDTRKILQGLAPTNQGAFELEGGKVGDRERVLEENALPPGQQTLFNIPTNGRPSPLYNAQPFSQQMLLFEAFGLEPLDPAAPPPSAPFPQPSLGAAPEQDPSDIFRSGPSGADLDAFLGEPGLFPFPSRYANVVDANPWNPLVKGFLKRTVLGPAEGRPPGMGWSHQRWDEFYPQQSIKTVQAGARTNGGVRDGYQRHGYGRGEFAPGGLYYNTAGLPGTEGTTAGIQVRFHPNMPVQDHNSVWTFDGTLPPKLLMVRYGQPLLFRHYNGLPIDPAANHGFGLHTISTHEHNGHTPAESDGYTNAFYFPGQFYDYRWPIQLAGYDSINTTASDPRAAFPCDAGEMLWVNDESPGMRPCQNGRIQIRGDWRETMSTHWFHDHMLDFTAQNVYKGNAAMMNYYSAVDRGNEALEDGINLRFPSGSAASWGNRDYDVNLMVADKAWDQQGQLWFNPFNTDGFLGDQILTNWLYKPWFNVRARSYRFRILNGSVSRYLKLALVRQVKGTGGELKGPKGANYSYARVPFHMIANDGNIMEHAVPFDGTLDLDHDGNLKDHFGILPSQGIAERYDIVVNFGKHGIRPGDKLYFVNLLEHDTGQGSKKAIDLADVLSEKYKPVLRQTSQGLTWDKGDPGVGRFLELRVQAYSGQDLAMNPADYEPAKPGKAAGKVMIPLSIHPDDPADQQLLSQARHRRFEFGRSNGTDEAPWTIRTDEIPLVNNARGFSMDPRRIASAPQLATGATPAGYAGAGTLEIWKIATGGGWSHPVHVHFEEGIILSRGGKPPPEWEKWARKDVYRIGREEDSLKEVEFAIRIREFAGTYMEHCHNTQHEDTSMLLRWDAEHPGQVQLMPTPLPTWDGVKYVKSVALPTFRDGDGMGPQGTANLED